MRKQQHSIASKLLTAFFIFLVLPITIFMVQHIQRVQSKTSSIHYTIYGDSLAPGWENRSWASRVNFDNASPVYSGNRSISFTPTQRWASLYLYMETAVDTTPYSFLHLAARASQAGQHYTVMLYDRSNTVLSKVNLADYSGDPIPGTWKVYNIPLSDLRANATQIRGLAIQSRTRRRGTLYLGSIGLTGVVSSSSPTPPFSPTPIPSVIAMPTTAPSVSSPTPPFSPTPIPSVIAMPTTAPSVSSPTPTFSPTPIPSVIATPTTAPSVTSTSIGGPPDGQGLYESCLPGTADCLDHLNIMASKGFRLVLNYSQLWATDAQELAYAQQAHALGMKIIWAMNNPAFWNGTDLRSSYSGLASTCNCSDNAGFIQYVVNLVKDLPATWGYYIGDEVDPGNHAQVKAFSDLVHQTDPSHPRLFIGSSALPSGVSSVLSPFADTAEVLGLDYYPVGRTDIPNAINATADIAKAMQAVDNQTGKQPTMVLQAISLGEYPQFNYTCQPYPSCAPYPTVDQMNSMLNLTMQNAHPRLLLWYSYFDILKSDNPAQHWTDLCASIAS